MSINDLNLGPTDKVARVAAAAESVGHVLEDDSPGGISRGQRWTCTRCGKAVLCYSGNVYGTLADNPLTECA